MQMVGRNRLKYSCDWLLLLIDAITLTRFTLEKFNTGTIMRISDIYFHSHFQKTANFCFRRKLSASSLKIFYLSTDNSAFKICLSGLMNGRLGQLISGPLAVISLLPGYIVMM